jgi:hypothetical protein
MMKLSTPANPATNEAFAKWVMSKLGRPAVKPYQALAVIEDGRIVAGVVFNGYNGANVDITVYAPGRLSRGAIRDMFRYAFDDLQATRITARTRRSLRTLAGDWPLAGAGGLLERLGFRCEGIASRYYGTGPKNDALVYRMLRSECPKWVGVFDHGRTGSTGPKEDGGGAGGNEPRNSGHANRPKRAKPVHTDR